jgi:hypothetical protein
MNSNTKSRSFDPNDLIMLPVLDTSSAMALAEAMVSRAKEERLTAAEEDAFRSLDRALSELSDAHLQRFDAAPALEVEKKAAGRAWRTAWSALHSFLQAQSLRPTPESEGRAGALRILASVFEEGLTFVKLPYKGGWAEGNQRLRWLGDHEEVVEQLGGAGFLEDLREAHAAYGRVLGITAATEAPVVVAVRQPLDVLRAHLREYVLQVSAQGARGTAAGKEKARRLLAPIVEWPSQRGKVARDAGDEPVAEPVVEPPVG